jgi:hypothetical protein
VGPGRNDWAGILNSFSLAYNTSVHSVTKFSPAFLLFGFQPLTRLNYLSPEKEHVIRPSNEIINNINDEINDSHTIKGLSTAADQMIEEFQANRSMAREALNLGQIFQKKYYNQGRLTSEFEVGDLVLINPHSLNLLRNVKGKGQKLLMKYDGPFEILQKISPLAYRLRMPASYGTHPILNIAHLESYQNSPEEFGNRPRKHLNRDDFEEMPEYEVEKIIDQKWSKSRSGRRNLLYKVRFIGYSPNFDEWLTRKDLKNAPEILRAWEMRHRAKTYLKH